jgi:mutator protein MutT
VRAKEANHCPVCGSALGEARIEARVRRCCGQCGFVLFLNPASAAAGVVVNSGGEVLLVRRAIDPWRGYWALPAGYQELDEGPEQALAREIREEAGIEVEVVGLLDVLFVEEDPRKPANVAVYLCRTAERVLRPTSPDVSEAGWFRLDRLPADIGFENYERILARLEDPSRYPRSAWSYLESLFGGCGE